MIAKSTASLWSKQDQHEGDRHRLFGAVAGSVAAEAVLYPGCYVDIAPSFVFPSVTYIDLDQRTPKFFADEHGIGEIIAAHDDAPSNPDFHFIHGDYTEPLALPDQAFDLLVSLYAGPISQHCTRHLKVGGTLLVNPSHGDAALASLDDRYRLKGAVISGSGTYRIDDTNLTSYLIAKKPETNTVDSILATGRGIAYTKPAFAYLFTRIG